MERRQAPLCPRPESGLGAWTSRERVGTPSWGPSGRAADPELTAAPAWPSAHQAPEPGKCGAGRQGRATGKHKSRVRTREIYSHLWAINSAAGTAGTGALCQHTGAAGAAASGSSGAPGAGENRRRTAPSARRGRLTSATKVEGAQPWVCVCERHAHTRGSQAGPGPLSSPQSRGAGLAPPQASLPPGIAAVSTTPAPGGYLCRRTDTRAR